MSNQISEQQAPKGLREQFTVLLRMLMLVRPLAGYMALAVAAGTLSYLAAILIPVFGGYGICSVIQDDPPFSLMTVCVCLVIFALARAVLRYIEQRTNHYIAFTLLANIRDQVFAALRRLCPAKLEGRQRGDLIALITADVELMEVFFAHTVSPVCIALLTELVMVIFLAHYHLLLGFAGLLAYLLVGIVVPLVIMKHGSGTGEQVRRRSADMASFMLESIRGLDETLQYQDGEARAQRLRAQSASLSGAQKKLSNLTGFNAALTDAVIILSDLGMLLLAAKLCCAHSINCGTALISVIALMSSFGPVTALAALGSSLQNTSAAAGRVLSLLSEKPETPEITWKKPLTFSGASCQELSFSYRGGSPVLEHISMNFPQNTVIGITGRSGCGKSTLLKLLMRFWEPEIGMISISGRDINRINTPDLRAMESYMTQETHLFRDTIANNVRIGKPGASNEEIEAACKKAAIHDFILSLPAGYQTQVGELGETLSGGERQRIGLARAFLHGAPFMLLDEPTSNLDSLNEAVILKVLREESGGKTVVLVTHRLSTVRIADTVCALDDSLSDP